MKKLAVIGPGLLGGSIALALAQRLPGVPGLRLGAPRRGGGGFARAPARRARFHRSRRRGARRRSRRPLRADRRHAALAAELAGHRALARRHHRCRQRERPGRRGARARFSASAAPSSAAIPWPARSRPASRAARADLFAGSVCIVTPEHAARPRRRRGGRASSGRPLGCRVRQLAPDEHDEIAALISHSPAPRRRRARPRRGRAAAARLRFRRARFSRYHARRRRPAGDVGGDPEEQSRRRARIRGGA